MRQKRHANPNAALADESGHRSGAVIEPGYSQEPTLAPPGEVKHLSQSSPREKLIKIGAKVVRHGRYVTFQLAEIAIPRELFAEILRRIDGLRLAPVPP